MCLLKFYQNHSYNMKNKIFVGKKKDLHRYPKILPLFSIFYALIKFFFTLRSKEDLPLWSYYLKTLIIQMVIDKPDKDFWSFANLFNAFRDCLIKLNHAVLSTDLCDTFDTRLKLLTILPDSPGRRMGHGITIIEDMEESDRYDEEKAKLGENCRKFVTQNDYKNMSYILQDVVIGLQISMTYGPDSVIDFLATRVFRLKQFHKFWSKVEISILEVVTRDSDKSKIELKSVINSGGSSSKKNIFGSSILVATPEFRKRWKAESEWTKYTDEREEHQMFMKSIVSKDLQSKIIIFRSYLFQEERLPIKCTWCGTIFTNSKHIFWECTKVKEFWNEYCLKPGNWNKEYEMDDLDGFVDDLLNPKNLDLCSHKNNQSTCTKQHKVHMLNMAKEYLLMCQKVGVIPSHQEINCQFRAMQYNRTDHDFGRYWFNCPLPPTRGKPFFYKLLEMPIQQNMFYIIL